MVRCVLCALSGFVAPGGRRCLASICVPWLWPAACLSGVPRGPAWCAAPRPVRSLLVLRSAFPSPWCLSPPPGLAPPALLGGCAGHAGAGRQPGSLCLPLAPAEAGALGSLRVVPVRGPAMGLSLAGPSGIGLGLGAACCLSCWPCASRPSVRSRSFCVVAWLLVVAWWLPPPPLLCVLRFFLPPLRSLCFFFLVRAPVVSRFLWFPAPGALGLGAVLCVVFSSRLSALRVLSLFFFPAGPLAAPWCLVPPPPSPFLCVWLVSSLPLGAPPPFFFSFPGSRVRCRGWR